MEVDNDIDSQLLQQFSSMGTNDREVLIAEFQRLLGDQLNAAGCAFYLDMNNWNLQAAICSYYDLEQPQIKLPSMSFVRDITIGEGESIPPCTPFVKTWRIQNAGDETWPPGCCLKFVSGAQFGDRDRVMVHAVPPGAAVDVSVEMVSPAETGIHQGRWKMSSPTGSFFGEFIWVILHVEESGLMGVTQQLSQFGSELIHHSTQEPVQNPFASPVKEESSFTNVFPCPISNPLPTGSNSFEQSQVLLGSPMGSDIAQHGSFPSSPCIPTSVQGNTEPAQGRTAESVRTALFQNPGLSPCENNVIITPENIQDHQLQLDMVDVQQSHITDTADMS